MIKLAWIQGRLTKTTLVKLDVCLKKLKSKVVS